MVCSNCGKNLIRGYAFCLECGSPVPPEVLEEGGMPGRTDNEGRPSPNAESGNKSEKSAPDKGAEIPGIEPINGRENGETLVFCPNCGMHMQKDPYRCDKCGMKLSDKPKNVPVSASGVPLMNIDPLSNGVGGGLDGISESDLEQLSRFMNGSGNIPIFAAEEEAPPDLFGSSISANDFAALTEQLASFSASASDIPMIDIASETDSAESREISKSVEREVENFSMSDVSAAPVPLTDNGVPVIENHSMDEGFADIVDLDPYKFLNEQIDDSVPPAPKPEPKPPKTPKASETSKPYVPSVEPPSANAETVLPEKNKPEPEPKTNEPSKPYVPSVEPPSADAETVLPEKDKPDPEPAPSVPPVSEFLEETPFIEESVPFISEFIPEQADGSPSREEPAPPVSASLEKTEPPKQEPDNTSDLRAIFGEPVAPSPQTAAQAPAAEESEANKDEQPRGNLFRCQYCGQAMYDTDKVCKNCGASYKSGFAQPQKKSKAPLYIGICAIIIAVLAVVMYFVILQQNNNPVVIPNASAASSSEISETTDGGTADTPDDAETQ